MYRVDSTDPHNYDLVLDSNSLGLPVAVEVLVRAIEAGRPLLKIEAGAGPVTTIDVNESARPA